MLLAPSSCPELLPPSTAGPASQEHHHSPGWQGGQEAFTGEDAQAPARGSGLCKASHPGDGMARMGGQVSSC